MTRLIFTCLVLLVSLMAIQYTIWSDTKKEATNSEPAVIHFQKVHNPVIQREYIFGYDDQGNLIVIEKEQVIEI